jgi:hypothetical protein
VLGHYAAARACIRWFAAQKRQEVSSERVGQTHPVARRGCTAPHRKANVHCSNGSLGALLCLSAVLFHTGPLLTRR